VNESVWNREFSLCLGVSDVDARGVMPFKQVKAQAHCHLRQLFQFQYLKLDHFSLYTRYCTDKTPKMQQERSLLQVRQYN